MISSHRTTRPHNLLCGLLLLLLTLSLSSLCVRAERAHLPPRASQRTHTFPQEEPVGYRRLTESESLSLLRSLSEDESLPFASSALALHALYDVYTVQQDDNDTLTDTHTDTRSLRSHNAHTQRPVQMRFRPLSTDSLTHTETHTETHTRTLSQPPLTHTHTLTHTLTHTQTRTLTDRRTDRSTDGVTQVVPLYPGYGTHFVYVYVGTPPQRQSVIVDTGSHLTAFPCTGCAQCGTHTDPYFSVENSSSSVIPRCLNNQRCLVSQSYTEGSSWKGYKVQDKLHMGGNTAGLLPLAERLSVPFVFACQTSETGLFRTQLADGIMGLSHSPDTLPHTLRAHNLTHTLAFALCYRIGGGVLTLGGVDPRLHHFRGGAGSERGGNGPIGMKFARTYTQQNGWFGVRLLGLHLLDATSSSNTTEEVLYPVETDVRILNGQGVQGGAQQGGAKGVIVDSGTTDTYLPKSLSVQFMNAFARATQRSVLYSTSAVTLTPAQLQRLPVIVFTLEGAKSDESDNGSGSEENNVIRVYMPYTSYLDAVGNGRYAFRVYLTESSGAVLGANFMLNHNILFDAERERVGFAPSPCDFQEFVPPPQLTQPTKGPTKTPQPNTGNTLKPSVAVVEEDPVISALCDAHTPTHTPTGALAITHTHIAFTECSAKCTRNDSTTSYTEFGAQQFVPSPCLSQSHNTSVTYLGGDRLHTSASIITHSCHENCTRTHAVRGPTQCPDTPWSECTHGCVTSRRVVPLTEPLLTSRGECNYRTQTQTCYTGHCPVENEDYMVYVDLRVRLRAREWSYVHTESFVEALKRVYKLKYNGIEILNNVLTASSSSSASTKLHIQIRLKAKDYTTSRTLHAAAERIIALTQDTLPQTNPQARFPALFVAHLRSVAVTQDRGESDRFGWMIPPDITVLSAVALPVSVSDQRDPHSRGGPHTGTDSETDSQTTRTRTVEVNLMLLLGVGLGVCVSLSVVVFLYVRLRQQLALLSKDKPLSSSSQKNKRKTHTHTLSADVLLRVWNKFAKRGAGSQAHTQSSSNNTQGDVELASLTREQLEEELRLAQSGLIAAESEEEEN